MRLASLTFSPRIYPLPYTTNVLVKDSLKRRIFVEFEEIWQRLQFQIEFRDTGENSKQINKKELAKKRKRLKSTEALQAFEEQLPQIIEQYIGLNKLGYKEFVQRVKNLISEKYRITSDMYLKAWELLADFIKDKNKVIRLKESYYAIPAPPQSSVGKDNTLRFNSDWIKNGKKFDKVLAKVIEHWQERDFYHSINDSLDNQTQAVGWLLFSGIAFGGINDKLMLSGWLNALLKNELFIFIDYRVVAKLRYDSESYGNERVEHNGKTTIYNSQQICVDLVSQMWLACIRQIPSSVIKELLTIDLEVLINQALQPVISSDLPPFGTLNFLLKSASYNWEDLDDVSIDQAYVGILQGKEKTTGLLTSDFESLFFSDYANPQNHYPLTELTAVPRTKKKLIDKKSLASYAQVRRSDLIVEIKNILDKTYDKHRVDRADIVLTKQSELALIVEDLTNLLNTFEHISEYILIQWIISLFDRKIPVLKETAKKYLSSIGYDWLYYTLGEDLLSWEEENFEIVYEQILDFKSLVMKNENISFSADRLQQLHDFAHKEFGIVKVNVPGGKSQKRVRAEWVSPALYQATLRQIRQSVEPLEADMLIVLFIFLMRTGLRKLELLGLKYNDIENVNSSKPSIIVRPNQFRRLKTDVSNRRIPLYAVMLPSELQFVLKYLQSNRTNDKQQLIFTLSSSKERLPSNLPNLLLSNILKDINPTGRERTIHGFRHTSISNFSLILNADADLASTLTGFEKTQIAKMQNELKGEEAYNQFGWYLVAGLAGHLSPKRGIEYYNHFAMLAASYEMTKANPMVTRNLVVNLTGLTIQNLNDNKIEIVDKPINLCDFRKILYRKSFTLKHSPKMDNLRFINNVSDILEAIPTASNGLFGQYSLNKLVTLLQDFEKGLSEAEIVIKLKIKPNDIALLKERAIAIANIKTMARKTLKTVRKVPQSQPRFVNADNTYLAMTNFFNIEQRMLHEIMKMAVKFRASNPSDWQWFIKLLASKITTSHASISFSKGKQDVADFQRFIAMAEQVFTLEYCMYASPKPQLSLIAEALQFNGFAQMPATQQSSLDIASCLEVAKSLHFKEDNTVGTILFGIKVENAKHYKPAQKKATEQQSTKKEPKKPYKYMFSPLLRFFTHMMLLQDDTYFELDEDKKGKPRFKDL